MLELENIPYQNMEIGAKESQGQKGALTLKEICGGRIRPQLKLCNTREDDSTNMGNGKEKRS